MIFALQRVNLDRRKEMYDIEDIGESGDVRDDSAFKRGKVTSRKHQRKDKLGK